MNLFIVSGAPNTGKSTTVYHLCTYLLNLGYVKTDIPYNGKRYSTSTSFPPILANDFSCLLEKEGKKVLIHTATDDVFNIDALVNSINNHKPSIVITTCRDFGDWPRDYFCSQLKLVNSFILASTSDIDIEEFPLSRIKRRTTRFATAYEWYFINSTHQIEKILSLPPYSI